MNEHIISRILKVGCKIVNFAFITIIHHEGDLADDKGDVALKELRWHLTSWHGTNMVVLIGIEV